MTAEWTNELQVYCADIGSIGRGNFAWASRHPPLLRHAVDPMSIESLAAAALADLKGGRAVALGFEMPLFLPVTMAPGKLGKARATDKDAPSWSSSTGASVMATGIVQAAWVLRSLFECLPAASITTSWDRFAAERDGLLVWEAFVTRGAKGVTHEEDAAIGVKAFCNQLPAPGDAEADEVEGPLSLAAAICVWAGWPLPPAELRQMGTLVRAKPRPECRARSEAPLAKSQSGEVDVCGI